IKNKPERRIARELNEWGIKSHLGNPWRSWTIRRLLSNENYIGTNIYNRKTARLGQPLRANSTSLWIRQLDSFEAIIDPELFAKAQQHRMQRRITLSDREMLAALRSLL